MATSEFFKSSGQYDQTIDITSRVLRDVRGRGTTVRVPFIPYPGRVHLVEAEEPKPLAEFGVIEVGYERYSMTTVYRELVKQEEWGDNDIKFFENHLVTVTFLAPNTMRIVR